MTSDEESPVYAIRLLSRAAADVDAARDYVADTADAEIAHIWRQGLNEALRKLARFPRLYPIADPENGLLAMRLAERGQASPTVRVLLYRRPGTGHQGPAWRILFTTYEATESDVARVIVLHVRHAARKPFTSGDADSLASDLPNTP